MYQTKGSPWKGSFPTEVLMPWQGSQWRLGECLKMFLLFQGKSQRRNGNPFQVRTDMVALVARLANYWNSHKREEDQEPRWRLVEAGEDEQEESVWGWVGRWGKGLTDAQPLLNQEIILFSHKIPWWQELRYTYKEWQFHRGEGFFFGLVGWFCLHHSCICNTWITAWLTVNAKEILNGRINQRMSEMNEEDSKSQQTFLQWRWASGLQTHQKITQYH